MPATGETMETAHGMQEAPPMKEEKPEWWASPATLGLMGFATTTILAGLSNLPAPVGAGFGDSANGVGSNWTVYGMAIAFGGIAQLLAGIIALRKGNMFAGSAFVGYGSFWIAFTLMLNNYVGGSGIGGAANPWVGFYGVAGFAFVWMLFTFAFLINAPKHGWGITAVFFLLWIAFILLTVKFYQFGGTSITSTTGPSISSGESWAIGVEIILTGVMAFYVAMADLTNWNYGRKILPV
jgi:uncharacterized protein